MSTTDQLSDACAKWLGDYPAQSAEEDKACTDALYAFSECGLFDGLSIDPELGWYIYRVIDKVRRDGFPEKLRI